VTDHLAIEAQGLRKTFGNAAVVAGIDLAVPRGSVFALLGPNGAGKTTTVRILATLLRADAGTARVAGHDVVWERSEVRRRISLTGQYVAVDELQTGEENLRVVGRLLGLDRAEAAARARALLARFDLVEAGARRVATWSGGMRRRLDLAASLVGHPSVLFLDEPTTGLDPRSRIAVWEAVAGLVDGGVTVFLTTQYLEEADQLAGRIAILDAGRVVAEGSPAQLKHDVTDQRLDLVIVDADTYASLRVRLGDRVVAHDDGHRTLGLPTDGTAAHVRAVLDEVDPDRTMVTRFALRSATLDDVFLALTGHPATADGLPPAEPVALAAHDTAPEPAHV
jgi:ABC-2 type transport system ATP-binding protein